MRTHRSRAASAAGLLAAASTLAPIATLAVPAPPPAHGPPASEGRARDGARRVVRAASVQEAPRRLTVDDLFRLARVGSPKVSPDGEWVAYTVSTTSLEDERSYTRVWLIPSAGGEAVPMTGAESRASSPEWSPDGRYFSFLTARDGDETQVWVVDRRGGEPFPLTDVEQGVESYRWAPDGGLLLLAIRDPEEEDEEGEAGAGEATKEGRKKENAPRDPWVVDRLQFKRDGVGYLTGDRHTHLYVFDLATEELRQLTTGRWDEGDAEWSPDGTKVAFTSNRTADPDTNRNTDLWIVDADLAEPTEAPRRVTDQPGPDASPAWSPDGRFLAYVTTTDVDAIWYATSHLAVIPAEGGEPRLLTTELDRNPRAPRWSDDGAWIWFGLEDSAEDHLARVRPDGSGLERPVAGPVSAGSFDWAGGTFALELSTLERPAEIHVLGGGDAAASTASTHRPGAPPAGGAPGNSDGSARSAAGSSPRGAADLSGDGAGSGVRRLTRHNDAWLAELDLGETHNVHFPSRDGTEIEGFVAFPPDFVEGRRYPVLLRIHGGPVSQYRHSFNFEARLFAAHGYIVVYTNPRGSSGYGQAFSEAIFADWGRKDFEDVVAGVDYAIERGWGDPDRLGVGGWSYGGILTNYVITRTDRFQGAVTGASEVLYVANYGHDHYQYSWEKELGLPWEGDNREVWERISPFNRAHLVTTPTLIMGGEEDWNVPILNSEQLYQVLRRVGTPTELVVYPGQSHGIRVPSYQKDRYERYLAWYDRWVKGTRAEGRPVS